MVTKTKTQKNEPSPDDLGPEPSDEDQDRARAVRALNNAFRINFTEAQLYLSPDLLKLSKVEQGDILNQVRHYRRFSEANDPAMTHCRGFFRYRNHKIVWTIYYHDCDSEYSDSQHTIDLNLTKRWMMVMTSSESWEKDLQEAFF